MLYKKLNIEAQTAHLPNYYQAFARFLRKNCMGKSNAMKARALRPFGVPVEIRELVHALRVAGVPICSGGTGYYFAETLEELDNMTKSLKRRAEAIMEAQEGLDDTHAYLYYIYLNSPEYESEDE